MKTVLTEPPASTKISFKAQMLMAREDAIVVAVNRLLAEKGFDLMTVDQVALEVGIARFGDVSGLMARWRFAGLAEPDLAKTIAGACYGLRSFAELKGLLGEGGLERILLEGAEERGQLEARAPARVKLAKGRSVAVNYVDGQTPWVASRLQDFFGMRQTPLVGQTPVVVHLLAPNQRPVQVTQDLAGFWERHYPALRRELGRRYPRHAWPEDPFEG